MLLDVFETLAQIRDKNRNNCEIEATTYGESLSLKKTSPDRVEYIRDPAASKIFRILAEIRAEIGLDCEIEAATRGTSLVLRARFKNAFSFVRDWPYERIQKHGGLDLRGDFISQAQIHLSAPGNPPTP